MKSGVPLGLEIFKLTRRPLVVVVFFLIVAGFKGVALLASPAGVDAGREGSAFAYLAQSASISMKVWWLLLLCLAAASFSGERSRGVLRMHLCRPVSRRAFYTARLAAFFLVLLVLLCADALVGIGFAALFRTFGDVADPALQGPQFALSAMTWTFFQCYLLTFLGLAATLSLGFFFSVIFSNPVTAVAWAAGCGLVMEGVRLTFGGGLGTCMATGYNFIHFERMSRLARGIAEYTRPGYWTAAVIVPLVYLVILNLVSFWIFDKADVVE